jgi:hypothetical protein
MNTYINNNVIINASLEENKLENLKKSLEQKGTADLKNLYKGKSVNGSSVGDVLQSLSNGNITEKNLTDIMKKGIDEFTPLKI